MPIGSQRLAGDPRQLADGHAAPDAQQVHGEQDRDGQRDRRGAEEDQRPTAVSPGSRTTLPNVALRISSIGTAMMAISATDGGRVAPGRGAAGAARVPVSSSATGPSRDASSFAAMNSSGTSTRIRLPMKDPHQRR